MVVWNSCCLVLRTLSNANLQGLMVLLVLFSICETVLEKLTCSLMSIVGSHCIYKRDQLKGEVVRFLFSRLEEQSYAETPEDGRRSCGWSRQRMERDSKITSLTRANEPELLSLPQPGQRWFCSECWIMSLRQFNCTSGVSSSRAGFWYIDKQNYIPETCNLVLPFLQRPSTDIGAIFLTLYQVQRNCGWYVLLIEVLKR